tara:strand:+ start:255 stop:461 length:207 start_codon:yes stop_codon:yes gene_type:complete
MVRFISDGTWFDKGTECKLVADCSHDGYGAGIFLGIRTAEFNSERHPVGEKYEDEEYCTFDEFEVLDD